MHSPDGKILVSHILFPPRHSSRVGVSSSSDKTISPVLTEIHLELSEFSHAAFLEIGSLFSPDILHSVFVALLTIKLSLKP